jgi:hypothetical protein
LDDLDSEGGSDIERETDAMAQEESIPASAWTKLKNHSPIEVDKFAKENSI